MKTMTSINLFFVMLIAVLWENTAVVATYTPPCTKQTAAIRREWAALSPDERKDYINALHCLEAKQPIYNTEVYPGVRNRWDDFVATHINYTLSIHYSGLLLPWHRNFVNLWETALRQECGYRGYQPYWDWASNSLDLAGSPHFDGSETSLSGDGEYDDQLERDNTLPKGTGGGCVISGPFKNHTVNMGPLWMAPSGVFPPDAYAYNPHCLRRDLNTRVSAYCNSPDGSEALLEAADIIEFQTIADKGLQGAQQHGPHGCGHVSVGPSMTDLYAAAADPIFFLHHANLDRLWALWQEKDEEKRRVALNGTSSMYNAPDTPNVTLDSPLLYGELDKVRYIREMMDPMAEGLCYRYE